MLDKMVPKKEPKQLLWLNVSLLIFCIVLCLAVFELVGRYYYRAFPFDVESVSFVPLNEMEAALRWRFSPRDGRNNLGLRNREIAAKRAGQFRILFLGDSLIWGSQTSTGVSYTQRLETELNKHNLKSAGDIEVINAGVPGYTTFQELQFLKIYGLGMKPDLVVLGFVFNDLYFPYLHTISARKLALEPSVQLNRFDTRGFPASLFRHSYLAHKAVDFSERLARVFTGRPRFGFERRTEFFLAWKDYGWDHTYALVGEMRDLLAGLGIELMIMVFPVSEQLDPAILALNKRHVLLPQRKMAEICKHFTLECLDLTEPLLKAGGASLYEDYLHLSPPGNDIVFQELTPFVRKQSALRAHLGENR